MSCPDCDYYAHTPDRSEAVRWAQDHARNPDGDAAGIWAWSSWRSVRGVNHAWPFGTAACGTTRYRWGLDEYGRGASMPVDPDHPADASLPMCCPCLERMPKGAEWPPGLRDLPDDG